MKTFNKYIQEKYLIDIDTESLVSNIDELKVKYDLQLKDKGHCSYDFEINDTRLVMNIRKYIRNTNRDDVEKTFFDFNKSLTSDLNLSIGFDPGHISGKSFVTYYGRKSTKTSFYVSMNEDKSLVIFCNDDKYWKYLAEFIDYIFSYIKTL